MIEPVDLSAHKEDVDLIKSSGPVPQTALVLGSGLDPVAEALTDRTDIPFERLAGMRGAKGIQGQAGQVTLGQQGGKRIICFRGRLHVYQGFSAYEATYPVRLAAALGARKLVLTNAAGSVRERFAPGSLMSISDHVNLTGDSPLIGWPGPEGGNPFVPMTAAYDAEMRRQALESASELGIDLHEGVYAWLKGPAYETPAEVAYLRAIGVDVVGMSTVPEVIMARALGMRVLAVSSITNMAGGEALSHKEVLETGKEAAAHLTRLLSAILAVL